MGRVFRSDYGNANKGFPNMKFAEQKKWTIVNQHKLVIDSYENEFE